MVLQRQIRWSWWHCAAQAWVPYRRSSVSCREIVRILVQTFLCQVVASSHRSHAGVALAWAPAGDLTPCGPGRFLLARAPVDGESSNFVREIHLFLDRGVFGPRKFQVALEAFTHSKLFKQRNFYTEAFTHSKLSHTASVYTKNTYTQCFYTWQAFTHTEAFTQRNFYTQRSFYTQQAFTHKIFYTQNLLHTASFYRKQFLHLETFLYIIPAGIAAPKPDLGAKSKKKIEVFFKRNFERTITSAKIEKIC